MQKIMPFHHPVVEMSADALKGKWFSGVGTCSLAETQQDPISSTRTQRLGSVFVRGGSFMTMISHSHSSPTVSQEASEGEPKEIYDVMLPSGWPNWRTAHHAFCPHPSRRHIHYLNDNWLARSRCDSLLLGTDLLGLQPCQSGMIYATK